MYKKNIWKDASNEKFNDIMQFCDDYKNFLSYGKTERLVVKRATELSAEKGFKPLTDYKTLKAGDKVYFTNKGKNIAVFIIGKKPILEGLRVLGAHIDSPRIDLKQNPLYERTGFAMGDTHYYGGIKKYQWVTTPLALHGVVCKKDGSIIDVNIGENPDDPVVGITDLLIHLSADQMQKNAAKVIEGEDLDITLGNIPLADTDKEAVKANVLSLLANKYDIEEEDFISAEIEIVPVGQARDYGLDRSMIAGYGHDDRVCAYTSLRAILDQGACEYTTCAILVDKEEVGSIGATGAQSEWFKNIVAKLLVAQGSTNYTDLATTFENTKMLSSDVSCAVDPLYSYATPEANTSLFAHGIVFNKYTGARGKSGCNDAMPEYVAWCRNVMDENNIHYQTSELGKVDLGGGGTIAYILGNYNMNVIDAGVPVLNMHAPMEIVSKADVYEAYCAYKAFISKN